MDVGVTEFRAHLREWLARASDGDEIVVTDRGVPVARLLGIESSTTLTRLTREGVVARPQRATRPTARGRSRPRPRHAVADLVSEHRR